MATSTGPQRRRVAVLNVAGVVILSGRSSFIGLSAPTEP